MRIAGRTLYLLIGMAFGSVPVCAQVPDPGRLRVRVDSIAKGRSPVAEAAARAFLPLAVASLDTLKTAAPDAYWYEVAALVVQSEMVKVAAKQDPERGRTMEQMFTIEFSVRALQRDYRAADQAGRLQARARLEQIIAQRFDIESRMMELELADATRRLEIVRAELAKRPAIRAERIRSSVDDVLR